MVFKSRPIYDSFVGGIPMLWAWDERSTGRFRAANVEGARMDALPADTSSVVDRLAAVLGFKMVAAICGVSSTAIVDAWGNGSVIPPPHAEAALRLADETVLALIDRMDVETVRGWFAGRNERLGRRSPAAIISERPADADVRREVLQAASSFLVD